MKTNVSPQNIKNLLQNRVAEVIERGHLEKKLLSGKPLRVKLGIDPTSPELHLGHGVVLRKLREFQEMGHHIILIIGDFTATIGDPSGRLNARPPLSDSEVKTNMKDYLKQASGIIDIKRAEVHYNSEWLANLRGKKFFELLSLVSLNQILEREDFSSRFKEHKSIRMYELLYPIMQAYDSVATKADVECGGTDQKFNLLAGRQIMERFNLEPQDIVMVPLLEGLDGERKMSKSFGNYVSLRDKPNDMFGKIMSLKDELLEKYFKLTTDLSEKEIKDALKSGPLLAKEKLAFEIASFYCGETSAKKARDFFVETFREKKTPGNVEVFYFSSGENLGEVLKKSGAVPSLSEYRRFVSAGAIEINGEILKNPAFRPEKECVVRVGKKRFLKIKPK